MTAIAQYLENKQHGRLLIRQRELVCVSKSQIGIWTRFKAWLGAGPASLKNVCAFLEKNPPKLDPEKWAQFRQTVVNYNRKHVFWKRVKKIACLFPTPILEKVWREYRAAYPNRCERLAPRLKHLHEEKIRAENHGSAIDMDWGNGNLIKELSSAAFYPFLCKSPDLEKKNFDTLSKAMGESFQDGRSFFVTRLWNQNHAVAAAFRKDGKFKIIDSSQSGAIDIKKLTQKLNQASIKDRIRFRGEYVQTHLQNGDSWCEKYATLYAHQMAKAGHFRGYKQLNAAFAQGQLKTFEDLKKIRMQTHLKNAGNITRDKVHPFIQSWLHRCLNISVDRLQDLKVSDITKEAPEPTEYETYRFQAGEPVYASHRQDWEHWPDVVPGSGHFILVNRQGQEIPIPSDRFMPMGERFCQKSFAELEPVSNQEIHFLIRSGNGTLEWIKLFKGERLHQIATKRNGSQLRSRDLTASLQ